MALEPGSLGPQSVEARPSAWGGLGAILDTPMKRGIAIVVLLALMVAAPIALGPYATVILTNALLYAILALGLNIVVGYAGLLDLGYAAFFAVGAYSIGILTTAFGWNFWAAIPVAVLAGIIIGGPTLRLRSDYLAIVTLGFGEIVRITARNLQITGAASGIIGIEQPYLFGWHIASQIDF
jgi:branched-chain amino acid transport system permease protein